MQLVPVHHFLACQSGDVLSFGEAPGGAGHIYMYWVQLWQFSHPPSSPLILSLTGSAFVSGTWCATCPTDYSGATCLSTLAPTDGPSTGPTNAPTYVPTDTPTDAPTAVPTAVPTDTPTAIPTQFPTASPIANTTSGGGDDSNSTVEVWVVAVAVASVIVVCAIFVAVWVACRRSARETERRDRPDVHTNAVYEAQYK